MSDAQDFEAVTGKGVKGKVDGKPVALGNLAMISDLGLVPGELTATANVRRDEGETVMFVVLGDEIAGLVSVTDPVKETTPAAIEALHDLGFRVIMATGDNDRTAKAIGVRLGIDEIRADVLPEDKARIVRELQEAGHPADVDAQPRSVRHFSTLSSSGLSTPYSSTMITTTKQVA